MKTALQSSLVMLTLASAAPAFAQHADGRANPNPFQRMPRETIDRLSGMLCNAVGTAADAAGREAGGAVGRVAGAAAKFVSKRVCETVATRGTGRHGQLAKRAAD